MRAKKRFGQNFLRDAVIIRRIVDAAGIREGDAVIEIGPGDGALTAEMLERKAYVTAIEIDRDLAEHLQSRFAGRGSFRLINGDALSFDLAKEALHPNTKIVANLPYNISTPMLQRFVEHRDKFGELTLMFQREVVERITAPPGNSGRGFLSVIVQDAFNVERLFDVPPNAFAPIPKVWSSVARFTPRAECAAGGESFRLVVSAGFAQKRKTLENNLKRLFPKTREVLEAIGIDPRDRAESLSADDWRKLAAAIQRRKSQDR